MYLSQLKEKYPLVYQRVEKQANNPFELTSVRSNVNNILSWINTTEGATFWDAVYYENWDLAKELEPSLFPETEEGNVKIIINGLFK